MSRPQDAATTARRLRASSSIARTTSELGGKEAVRSAARGRAEGEKVCEERLTGQRDPLRLEQRHEGIGDVADPIEHNVTMLLPRRQALTPQSLGVFEVCPTIDVDF